MNEGGFGSDSAFEIEVTRGSVPVGRVPASVASCHEDTLFREIVAGRLPNDGTQPPCVVTAVGTHEPNPTTGGEVASSSAMADVIELRLGSAPPRRYAKEVFTAQANAFVADLLERGSLKQGDEVEWRLTASEQPVPKPQDGVRVVRQPLPFLLSSLPDIEPGNVSAEIDATLLGALQAQFRSAGPVERAWLLVGEVTHDAERGAACVHAVTAVDVARGRGGASMSHFAFEPSAFVQARNRATRDFDGLIPVGWAHSHPVCEDCPQNLECPAETRFFSSADVEVHTTAFPSPYMIALVIGKAGAAPATEPAFRLYGWRDAQVREIQFRTR
ncbi:MAG: hypothetical protein GY944_07465 [bacterium]|nr:hypothetical protein [bacterium]